MASDLTLGQRVLALRKELGKTQIEMAKTVGVATATWQKVERDEGLPTGETLMQFEKLGINPGWVLTGLGPKLLIDDPRTEKADAAVIIPSIYKAIKKMLVEINGASGLRLQDDARDDEAAHWYNQLVAMARGSTDAERLRSFLPALQYDITDAVKSAAANPGAGKRSAS